MHEVNQTLTRGTTVRGRYLVIDLLGKGGFSSVYLVQDQQRENSLFALKEVIALDKQARERFIFEFTVLERLVHPALPKVHKVFDNDEHDRLYMLMDYVEGPNLETLRNIQPEKRFSLPVTTAILAPVVDALEYLHQQDPPIIHRDIKPANIIVPIVGGKTILVDFGIAKMYDTFGTTSAVRHASPGYGAPEHYTTGTNIRTDIYGLGATVFTLLTGDIPPDAIERMTRLGNGQPDPLKPVSELTPFIPQHISRAIQRSTSINMMQRYATVREFWQTLQAEPGQKRISEALDSIVGSPTTTTVSAKTGEQSSGPLQEPDKLLSGIRTSKRSLLPLLLLVLLIVGSVAGFWTYNVIVQKPSTNRRPKHPSITLLTPTTATPGSSLAATPTGFLKLFSSYNGTIYDTISNVASSLTLTHMQQKAGHFSGYLSSSDVSGRYSGTLDHAQHIYIYVTGSKQFYFWGVVQKNGQLGGQFCTIDPNSGLCSEASAFGIWNAAPYTVAISAFEFRYT